MKQLKLKPKKEVAVQRFHPWVFSGAVAPTDDRPADGELVELFDHQGRFLAIGHYQEGSISLRILTHRQEPVDQAFWLERLRNAFEYRRQLGLAEGKETDCYRLVHGEGDGLPGLIIDVYRQTAVVQCHSIGMHQAREDIAAALMGLYGQSLLAVYDKSKESLPTQYAETVANGYLQGSAAAEAAIVMENGHAFRVDWEGGQKTGFFLDQRDNRALVGRYADGRKVLNAFSYSGGFSVYALAAGALQVDSVDVSKKAIELAEQNVELNDLPAGRHRGIAADVMHYLRHTEERYDLMVVDPPAFAKSIKKRHTAVQAYKRLNAEALRRIEPEGSLFTFSCSQVVDVDLFYHTIVAAAIEAGRRVRVMHRLSQPPDHPVSLFHPEGSYLKGLALEVE